MPKIVDHDERRRMIAGAVTDIAATDGLGDVSFRTVADRAGVSVSLVQHYFGDKANLLKPPSRSSPRRWTPDRVEARRARRRPRADRRAPRRSRDVPPARRRKTALDARLPGLCCRRVHRRDLARQRDVRRRPAADRLLRRSTRSAARTTCRTPDQDATGLLSLVLGLSTSVLLEQITPTEATAVLKRHIDRITG